MCHNIPFGAYQFNVQDTTEIAAFFCICPHYVCLEPDGLALEIPCVVKMQIDFLLWQSILPFRRRFFVFLFAHSIEIAIYQGIFGVCARHDGSVFVHRRIIPDIIYSRDKIITYFYWPVYVFPDIIFGHINHYRVTINFVGIKCECHVIHFGEPIAGCVINTKIYGGT